MINANGLQANPLGGFLDTPADMFDTGGGVSNGVINQKFDDAVQAAQIKVNNSVSDAKAKIEQAAAAAQAKLTQAKTTARSTVTPGQGSTQPTEIDPSYTHPLAVVAGLAAGVGTAVAVYHAREKHGKDGIFVPAAVGVVVDSIIHFSTAQIIQHTR